MFDFMKDLYFEMNDFDMDMIRKERKIKEEKENSETIIFKKKTKIVLMIIGIILFAVSILGLIISVHKMDVSGIIKNIILMILYFVTMICLVIRKRQTEIVSLFGMVLILILNFVLPMI